MSILKKMPKVVIDQAELRKFGEIWKKNGGSLSRTPPYSSMELGRVFDRAIGKSLAGLLGGIPVVESLSKTLTAQKADCVEVGDIRVIGGVRPQNFDVGYRPDGLRFAFDSKTLNDEKSIKKNWQNMINDLATEATTVHTRFPHALVAFAVIIPKPILAESQRKAITDTLERLAKRVSVRNETHMAEVISFVLWNPEDGSICQEIPKQTSPLRLEKFSEQVEEVYVARYKGLPPHTSE